MKRFFSFIGWVVLITLLAGVGYRKVLTVQANKLVVEYTEGHRAQVAQYLGRFLSDKLAWKRIELFNPAPAVTPRDAGEWLNARLSWLPAGTARGSGSAPKAPMLKGFAGIIRDGSAFLAGTEKMAAWLDDWAAHSGELFPPGKVPFADFSWMAGLSAYSYWDVEASPKVKSAAGVNPKFLLDELPEPAWGELETWDQLRLLHGIAMRSLAPALKDSRTIIRLLLSTEYPGGLELAVRLLRREGQAEKVYVQRVDPHFVPTALQPETVIALEAYLKAFPGMLDAATDPQTLGDAFLSDGQILGLCTELNTLSPRIFRDRVLLSDAYAYGLEAIGRIIQDPANRCRIRRVKALWGAPAYIPSSLTDADWSPQPIPELPGLFWVSRTFDLRSFIGDDPAWAALPEDLRGSSGVRRAVGIALKKGDDADSDPWARYARQK